MSEVGLESCAVATRFLRKNTKVGNFWAHSLSRSRLSHYQYFKFFLPNAERVSYVRKTFFWCSVLGLGDKNKFSSLAHLFSWAFRQLGVLSFAIVYVISLRFVATHSSKFHNHSREAFFGDFYPWNLAVWFLLRARTLASITLRIRSRVGEYLKRKLSEPEMNNTLQAETTSIVINICEKIFQHSDAVCSSFRTKTPTLIHGRHSLRPIRRSCYTVVSFWSFALSSRVRSFIDARISH